MIGTLTIYAFLLSDEISAYKENDTYWGISAQFYFSVFPIWLSFRTKPPNQTS